MFNQIPIMRFASRLLTASIIILSLVRGAVAQQGVATDLDSELSKFAQRVLKLLDEQEQPNITIGTITGTGRGSIPGGPGIAAKLASALEQGKKDVISNTAIWSIEGRMLFGDPNANGKLNGAKASTAELSLTVFFTLINQGTQAKVEDKIIITKLTQAPFLLGTTFQTSPEADIKESRKDFVESLNLAPSLDPKHKSRIRPRADTPFALELRAKPIGAEAQGGIPVDARIENRPGIITTQKQPFAFAPIARNQEYEVVIYNDSPDATAACRALPGQTITELSNASGIRGYEPGAGNPPPGGGSYFGLMRIFAGFQTMDRSCVKLAWIDSDRYSILFSSSCRSSRPLHQRGKYGKLNHVRRQNRTGTGTDGRLLCARTWASSTPDPSSRSRTRLRKPDPY